VKKSQGGGESEDVWERWWGREKHEGKGESKGEGRQVMERRGKNGHGREGVGEEARVRGRDGETNRGERDRKRWEGRRGWSGQVQGKG